jgi:hypothetical protein
MKNLNKTEKKEFVKFIKSNFGDTNVYSEQGYPLYFDKEGNMKRYDLNEDYKIFKEINK